MELRILADEEKLMGRDWLFAGDGYLCDLRAVGVCVQDDMLLVQRNKDGKEYALPGGHVQVGETTRDGLVREYREEVGADIRCGRLLWTEECFWHWNGTEAHSIAFYYLVELRDVTGFPIREAFVPQHDNANVLIGWISIESLKDVVIYPEFIKREINHLDAALKHFVTRS